MYNFPCWQAKGTDANIMPLRRTGRSYQEVTARLDMVIHATKSINFKLHGKLLGNHACDKMALVVALFVVPHGRGLISYTGTDKWTPALLVPPGPRWLICRFIPIDSKPAVVRRT